MSRGEAPPGEGRFLIQVWPEGCVVFDRQLGNTHAMDELTGAVFRLLLDHPDAEPAWLSSELGPQLGRSGPEGMAAVEQALAHLGTHGLMPREPFAP